MGIDFTSRDIAQLLAEVRLDEAQAAPCLCAELAYREMRRRDAKHGVTRMVFCRRCTRVAELHRQIAMLSAPVGQASTSLPSFVSSSSTRGSQGHG